ncbi:MAG: hypothetical protein ACLQUY_05370 [Ktedonobacterales bacterium]
MLSTDVCRYVLLWTFSAAAFVCISGWSPVIRVRPVGAFEQAV